MPRHERHPAAGRLPAVSGCGPQPDCAEHGALCGRDEVCRNLSYYPLGRFQHEQPGKALLQALSAIKLRAEAEQNDLRGQLQAALAENTRLNNQLTELQNSRAAYENSLENLYESSSWRLTAPLRALHRLFRH